MVLGENAWKDKFGWSSGTPLAYSVSVSIEEYNEIYKAIVVQA